MAACCNLLSARSGNESSANVATDGNPAPSSRTRRSLVATRWSLPALILILLPKCPACLAAYIALGTGVSLGVAASSYLRLVLLGLSIAAIALNIVWLAISGLPSMSLRSMSLRSKSLRVAHPSPSRRWSNTF